ncbi:hypothetical protein J7E49_13035 [Variovorax paradoxus]|nr:hypothetical protein [Variovorax paradoxus]
MPYLEILAPGAPETRKRTASRALTDGVVASFGVEPSTVTLYFMPVAPHDYAHEGQLGHVGAGEGPRVFVKVHAYRRTRDQRRALAAAITPALAACFGTASHNVAIYFLDRERDEVAHDGHLASDEAAQPDRTA